MLRFSSTANDYKFSIKASAFRRFFFVALITLSGAVISIILLGQSSHSNFITQTSDQVGENVNRNFKYSHSKERLGLPKQNELSIQLEKHNQLPPRNIHLYPRLAKDHIPIVLYVHNRPQYLKVVVESLSHVDGIQETLLIVSHDGYFKEMNEIVEGIRFCQVKQIFAPYSPHIFPNNFPGASPADCRGKDNATKTHCRGNPDQYGNHRDPKIVSLKHHWWWMMNTVWDGLDETREHPRHIVFIEEDHFVFPNAYRNIQILTSLKPEKCTDCYAANLAPSNVNSRGEGGNYLVAEKVGNVGYAFNRTTWRKIHSKATAFCLFDDYNWDITMSATVYHLFGGPVYSLRGPRASAVHFGKCGLHQGQGERNACVDNGRVNIEVRPNDKVANINSEWELRVYKHQEGYKGGFNGWGGWGDERDRHLCLNFAHMFQSMNTSSLV